MLYPVVILAGGLGTRLRPLTETIPKPLVDVEGHPFLWWQLKDLASSGLRDVIISSGYLGEMIEAYFGDGHELGLRIRYSREPEPLGTGGALKLACAHLPEAFFVLNGDSFLPLSYHDMQIDFISRALDANVAVYDNLRPTPVPNNLKVRDGFVSEYRKGAGLAQGYTHVDAGVYLIKRSCVEAIAETRFDLAQVLGPLIETQRLGAFTVTQRFYDIGTVERLKEFEGVVRDYIPYPLSP